MANKDNTYGIIGHKIERDKKLIDFSAYFGNSIVTMSIDQVNNFLRSLGYPIKAFENIREIPTAMGSFGVERLASGTYVYKSDDKILICKKDLKEFEAFYTESYSKPIKSSLAVVQDPRNSQVFSVYTDSALILSKIAKILNNIVYINMDCSSVLDAEEILLDVYSSAPSEVISISSPKRAVTEIGDSTGKPTGIEVKIVIPERHDVVQFDQPNVIEFVRNLAFHFKGGNINDLGSLHSSLQKYLTRKMSTDDFPCDQENFSFKIIDGTLCVFYRSGDDKMVIQQDKINNNMFSVYAEFASDDSELKLRFIMALRTMECRLYKFSGIPREFDDDFSKKRRF